MFGPCTRAGVQKEDGQTPNLKDSKLKEMMGNFDNPSRNAFSRFLKNPQFRWYIRKVKEKIEYQGARN